MKLILVIVTTLLALVGWLKPKKTSLYLKILASILLIIAALMQIKIEKEQYYKEEVRRFTGVLKSKSEKSLKKISEERIEIGWTINNSGVILAKILNFELLEKGSGPAVRCLQVLKDIEFKYDLNGQQLEVSMLIRDNKGSIIAVIERNEWKIGPPPKTFDRNFTKDMLEIINDKGQVILQIRLCKDVI